MAGYTLTLSQALSRAALAHKAGRFDEAEQLCQRIVATKHDFFDALHLLALVQARLDKKQAALASYDCALAVRPDHPEALVNRSGILRALKRLEEALASCDSALAAAPNYAEALFNRGVILHEMKRFEDALTNYRRALAVRPSYAFALYNRGTIFHELRRFEEAVANYDGALTARPDFTEALSNRGNTLNELKRFGEALATFGTALATRPGSAEALYNRGNILHELKQFDEALASYDRALTVRPDHLKTLFNRGNTLNELRRFDEALASYDRSLALQPDHTETLAGRANALRELGRFQEASSSCDRAITLKPDFAKAYDSAGSALKEVGRFDEARQFHINAIEIDPSTAGLYVRLADLKTFALGDRHLAMMEALAKRTDLSDDDRFQLDFALGKAYADLKDHQRSFKHLLSGNARKRATISYDEKSTLALFDQIAAVFTRELIAAKSGAGDPSRRPIFVFGMPRSGTTLVEQIIASHPTVHGAGELQTFNEVLLSVGRAGEEMISYPENVPTLDPPALRRIGEHYVAALHKLAPEGERVTDKMPSNYYFAGLIHLALPNATIIHTMRDPIDTCLSCFSKLFVRLHHTYDLAELGRYYKGYRRLMEHWRSVLPAGRILDVRYEDVVADLEGEARRIIAYCGLDWDERCLAFHRTERPVRTVSATQVRQPIYKSAVGRWRDYEPFLGPLLAELDQQDSSEQQVSGNRPVPG